MSDPIAIRPTVEEVASYVRGRTYSRGAGKSLGGQLLNTFNEETRPTLEEVEDLIDMAEFEVKSRLEHTITDEEEAKYAKNVVALRAAMGVELEYSPNEQSDSEDKTYTKLKDLYEQGMGVLANSLPDTNQTTKGIYSIPMVTGAEE